MREGRLELRKLIQTKRKKRIWSTFKIIGCFLLLVVIISDYVYSKKGLSTSYYNVSTDKLDSAIRIVQLTDIHSSSFGEYNIRLINNVKNEHPDLIVITGDLINSHTDSDLSMTYDLIRELTKITSVYISLGNQEKELESTKNINLAEIYQKAGAVVLDNEFRDIEVNNQHIRLGGIYGYCLPVVYAMETHREDESEFLMDFQNTNNYSILLCHMPVSWIESGSLYDWDVDCVLSGHAHGGQIRLPFIGGLWAPDQGWFPGRVAGKYTSNEREWTEHNTKMVKWATEQGFDYSYYVNREYSESTLILSRGLGNTEMVPRFNNTPEIVVVDFIPEEGGDAKDK